MNFAIKVRVETTGTTGTAETTERIFDTLFRCRLSRLCRLFFSKKATPFNNTNLTTRETKFLVRRG